MEYETRENIIKNELRNLHYLEELIKIGLQDSDESLKILDTYKRLVSRKDLTKENLKEIRLYQKILKVAIKEPEKAKILLKEYENKILEKRKQLAKLKYKKKVGR